MKTVVYLHEDKSYLYSQDNTGALTPHYSLKGTALDEATRILPIVREFHALAQVQPARSNGTTLPKNLYKNYKSFMDATVVLKNLKKLKNSPLKSIENNLNLYLDEHVTVQRANSETIDTLKMLSERLKFLSKERREKIEKKMTFIGRFFHKLAQFLHGRGWRTLVQRTDALCKKIDAQIATQEKIGKNIDEKKFDLQIIKVAKGDESDKEAVIQKLNGMDEQQFKSTITRVFTLGWESETEDLPSAALIYPALNDDKRRLFHKVILTQNDWYKLAQRHFFVDSRPIEKFDEDPYLEAFSKQSAQIFAKLKSDIINGVAGALQLTLQQGRVNQNPEEFMTWCRQNPHVAPKNYLSDFLQHLVRKTVFLNINDTSKIILMLEEMLKGPSEENTISFRTVSTLSPDCEKEYNQEISKITIQQTLSKDKLDLEVVEKLKENVRCENYHLSFS